MCGFIARPCPRSPCGSLETPPSFDRALIEPAILVTRTSGKEKDECFPAICWSKCVVIFDQDEPVNPW